MVPKMGTFSSKSIPDWSVTAVLALVLLISAAGRILERIWFRPKRLENILRKQGIRGSPYKLLSGDVKDSIRMSMEAQSKPLPKNSHDIVPRVFPSLVQITKDYGKTSFTWFGTTPRVIIGEPELIRGVLSSKFGHFTKVKQGPLGRFLLTGLIIYDGEKWVEHRRILNPAFHLEKLKCMLPAFATCCNSLIERWERLVASEGIAELDVWPELQKLAGEVISKTGFGSSYEEGKRILQLQTEQAQLLALALNDTYTPGYRFLPTRDNRRRKQIEKEVRVLLKGMIEKREKAMREGVQNHDLLGYLMESNSGLSQEDGKPHKLRMTIEEVMAECKLFFFAGHETTSVLITWTMILLSMHPNWQDQAREEVVRILGKNEPSFDDLNRLKIVPMILNEVLRLYPPASFILRSALKEIKLGESITIPGGADVLLPIILIHRDPEYWGKDANEFRPERFSEGIAKASTHQMAFFPFSGGPRVCIGQLYSMIEAKLTLSMILQRFSFRISPSYIHSPHSIISLQPQHGAQIILTKI